MLREDFGAVLGALLAFWNSRQGMVALMTATNIAYNERGRRGFFRQVALSLAFSLGGMLAVTATSTGRSAG